MNKTLFSQLESSGRFHRDSALGRMFHPGTVSYREKCGTDSVHLAVTPDNRVSVHVDSVSPLVLRDGRRCRYSFARALAHNVLAAVEACQRMIRGHGGRHACHLDCEIVWVPDDELPGGHGEPASVAGTDKPASVARTDKPASVAGTDKPASVARTDELPGRHDDPAAFAA